jgi:hypothetical protein
MMSKPNGNVQVRCAPRVDEYQAVSQPRMLNNKPMPRLMRIEGTMRLATAR